MKPLIRSDSRLTLSVPEFAARMGIGVSTAWDAVRAGDVPSIRLGKRVVISQLVVDRLLADPGAVQAQAQ